MSDEPMNLGEVGRYTAFHKAWEGFMSLLNVEEPPVDKITEFITYFKDALKWGEKYLASRPQDQEAQNMVEQLHDSLIGLGDIDKNQFALLYYWHGFHFIMIYQEAKDSGLLSLKSCNEFLEEQAIPSLMRALELAPDYIRAQVWLTFAQAALAGGDAVTQLEQKQRATTQATELAMESFAASEYCTDYENKDYRGKIRRATESIDKTQSFLAGLSTGSIDSDVYKMLQYSLAKQYFNRALAKYLLGEPTKDKQVLKSALPDLDNAVRFPDDCFLEFEDDPVDFRSSVQELRKLIDDAVGGCFIATAAYGSPLAMEVEILRQFRDSVLRQTRMGRLFIRIYETYSPPLADWIADHSMAREFVRRFLLTPIIKLVRHNEI